MLVEKSDVQSLHSEKNAHSTRGMKVIVTQWPIREIFTVNFFIERKEISFSQYSEYNTSSNDSENCEGSEEDENILSENISSCSSMSHSTNDVEKKILAKEQK